MGADWAMDLGAPEIIMILVIVLVLFGSTKIPKLARSLGEALQGVQEGHRGRRVRSTETSPAKAASIAAPESTTRRCCGRRGPRRSPTTALMRRGLTGRCSGVTRAVTVTASPSPLRMFVTGSVTFPARMA